MLTLRHWVESGNGNNGICMRKGLTHMCSHVHCWCAVQKCTLNVPLFISLLCTTLCCVAPPPPSLSSPLLSPPPPSPHTSSILYWLSYMLCITFLPSPRYPKKTWLLILHETMVLCTRNYADTNQCVHARYRRATQVLTSYPGVQGYTGVNLKAKCRSGRPIMTLTVHNCCMESLGQ